MFCLKSESESWSFTLENANKPVPGPRFDRRAHNPANCLIMRHRPIKPAHTLCLRNVYRWLSCWIIKILLKSRGLCSPTFEIWMIDVSMCLKISLYEDLQLCGKYPCRLNALLTLLKVVARIDLRHWPIFHCSKYWHNYLLVSTNGWSVLSNLTVPMVSIYKEIKILESSQKVVLINHSNSPTLTLGKVQE